MANLAYMMTSLYSLRTIFLFSLSACNLLLYFLTSSLFTLPFDYSLFYILFYILLYALPISLLLYLLSLFQTSPPIPFSYYE